MDAPHLRLARFRSGLDLDPPSLRYTQEQLADKLGCEQSFVGLVERGKRNPGLPFAAALERLTEGWEEGPIRAIDWSPARADAADPDAFDGADTGVRKQPTAPSTGSAER